MHTLGPLGESFDDAHPPSCAAASRAPATATAESVIPLLVVCNAKHWSTVGNALASETSAWTCRDKNGAGVDAGADRGVLQVSSFIHKERGTCSCSYLFCVRRSPQHARVARLELFQATSEGSEARRREAMESVLVVMG